MTETPRCWGIHREIEHSPGREADDAEILRATGRELEAEGIAVSYRAPSELTGRETALPALAFAMCEGLRALECLGQWEDRGVCVVNSTSSVMNTHRERTLPLFRSARVPIPESRVTDARHPLPPGFEEAPLLRSCWVKQASEHKTREGDVLFASDPASVREALLRLAERGLTRAVIQRHVAGDLLKFYGVAMPAPDSADAEVAGPPWFEWFYQKEYPVSGYAFDAGALEEIACRAARALGLDVWGGDAIVTAGGEIFVIDVNAWPSFALFRDAASTHIARHVAARFRRLAGVAV